MSGVKNKSKNRRVLFVLLGVMVFLYIIAVVTILVKN